jgi:DNA-binding response OmpR family regulator
MLKGGFDIMSEFQAMFLDEGYNHNIWCRHISKHFKMESYIDTIQGIMSEIEKTNPDVVVINLALYAKIDGIDTSRKIRSQYDVPVLYV